ncbi:Allatostatin-A receptor [Hypsibius exemplaris]|uniref:Allatostatin-A receptor n=1 Tax=Hypsibius exemplaris TaxID=2072580 RepID=A0A1W0WT47_HYPEX|nr:Allatostatin-A receptor [Hypsibius exemplaris]
MLSKFAVTPASALTAVLQSSIPPEGDPNLYTPEDSLEPSANCTPNSGYDYQDDRYMRHVVSIVVPVLFGVIVVLGLIGNAFVIAIVLGKRSKQLRNSTNLLIVNLACADLLFIIFCVPFTASDYVVGIWPFGTVWCKVVQYLVHVCAYSSVYTLVLMSVDRYLAVVHPISSMTLRTERNTYLALAIQWIVIMCSNIPLIIVHGTSYKDLHDCEWRVPCIFQFNIFDEPSFRLAFLGTFFILPVTIISSLYFIMLRRLWHVQGPVGHRSEGGNRSKKRVTRMVIAVVVIFVLCWSPITFILALKSLALYPINSISIPIQIAAHVLAYSNVCLNPFIYAAAHPGFRNSFKAMLCCGRIRSPGHISGADFERTDATGETTGFLRSRSVRQSSTSGRGARSRDGPGGSTANHGTVEREHIPLAFSESNHTNHTENGCSFEEDINFIPLTTRKSAAERQQSNDSIF